MSTPSFVYLAVDLKRVVTVGLTKDFEVATSIERNEYRRIVYLEEHPTALAANARAEELTANGQHFCAELVTAKNPDWKELRPFVPAGGSLDPDEPPGDFDGGVPVRNVPPPPGPLSAAAAIALDSE